MRDENNKAIENRGDEDQLKAKRDEVDRNVTSKGDLGGTSGKVGSDRDAARAVGGSGDFGLPEKAAEKAANPRTRDDEYGGRPRGSKMGQTGEESAREHGVGAGQGRGARGHGAGSGGESDPDIVGFGTAGGGSVTGAVNEPPGPDDAENSPSAHHGRNPANTDRTIRGTVHQSGPDLSTTGEGGSSGNVANADRAVDDAFAGEINEGEARGGDNAASDNRG